MTNTNSSISLNLNQAGKVETISDFLCQEVAQQAWMHFQTATERVVRLQDFQIGETVTHKQLVFRKYQDLNR